MLARPPARICAALVVVVLGLAACGDDDDGAAVRDDDGGSASGSGSGSGSGSEAAEGECVEVGDPATADVGIPVSLTEFAVELGVDDVGAGKIAFATMNDGTIPHELVVVRTDLAPDELPTDDEGGVDEGELDDDALIGEIEPFAPESECDGAFDLDPGDYVLFCNVVEDGVAHYTEGMHAGLSVSET